MIEDFPFYLGIIVLIVLIIMLSNKLKIAYPVLLVLAGLGVSFIPGVPVIKIDPELIFIIFLPPLLYEASWATSWKELWHWRRIIGSFAFVVVFLTAISVAFVANAIIPGFSLALGFLLGGIVSPPDAVSANAILKFVKVPKRVATILEGESLLNDASSLIVFKFAMIAVATGQFIWQDAITSFSWMVFGGVGIGLLIGFIFKKLHRILPTDVNIDIILTLVTPYIMYLVAEELHSSGVLSVVCGGLYLSYHHHEFLSGSSRLRAKNIWESLIFLLNGVVFILIGLDLPEIVSGMQSEGISLYTAFYYGVVITIVLVVGRVIACYGAVVTTIIMRNFIKVADSSNPGLKGPLVLGWTGMRGVVSLAAALSIPVLFKNGEAFTHRNLILFITFVVILLTLIVQGLTLPFLIKKITFREFNDHLSEDETEKLINKSIAKESLKVIKEHEKDLGQHSKILNVLLPKFQKQVNCVESVIISKEDLEIYLELLEKQREVLIKLNRGNRNIDEEVIRKHLHRIDLEEEKLI